jgi:hypothetical protein
MQVQFVPGYINATAFTAPPQAVYTCFMTVLGDLFDLTVHELVIQ